mmetsp:Transcript_419/g.964  ORF Transcript_419/g.964 Transcript_419/m.964 type:complete len:1229 (+) Transcript_419:32-3718(+)
MAITPSHPDVSSGHSKRGMKKRRRSQLHQIAWWVPSETTTAVRPDEEHKDSTLLSDGENWLVCSSVTTESKQPFSVRIVNSDLHEISGATNGNPFPFDEAMDSRNPKLADDAEESLAGDDNRTSIREGVALLCIDVDEKGNYVAVKDIRPQHKSSPNEDMMIDDDIAQIANNIDFFHARRKTYNELPVDKKSNKSNDAIVENGDNGKRLDDNKNCSSGESTSGYGSDDEEDGNDEVEELNEHNQVRFDDGPSSPSRESDYDDKGRALYHHPDPLPRRQLRVLQHGDRIILRYKTAKRGGGESSKVSIMKFEYIYDHQHHFCDKRKDCHDVKTHTAMPQASNGQRKPRLLSVKSADVKSTEKKRFTLNSTSAAEAPTAEEHRKTAMNGHHKAGKDWSALETENDDGPNIEAGKNDEGKNVAQKGGDDDDDDGGMEEYSYLTGEVVIKDQDYISAITGDEATNTARQPEVAGAANNDVKSDTSDGDDAATASAVILGAVTSPPKQPREDMHIDRGSNEKESSSPNRVTLGTTTREDAEKEDVPMANGDQNGKNGVVFEEEAAGKAEHENSQQTALFFTAPDHDESDDENMSGEELLSPVKPPKNSGEVVQHAVHFDSEALAAAASRDDDEGDGSVTDYSLTQPFPVPRNVTEQKRSTSSSSTEEEREDDDDDDDSTVCPEVGDIDDEKVEGSKPPPNESKDEDEEDMGVYDEPTQPIIFAPKSPAVGNQSDDDDDYHADTQFDIFTSSKKASIQQDGNTDDAENQNNPESIMEENVEAPTPTAKNVEKERDPIEDDVCEAAKSKESDHSAVKQQSPTKYPERKNSGKDIRKKAAIEKERLDNSAVHRVQSGAMMTGPVGGAVALASNVPNSLVKTAAMLQSIDPKTNPLPDSTEETVCQIDDAVGNHDDESDHAPATNAEGGNRKKRATRSANNQGISGDIGVRDPNIPTSVCITATHHDRETTPRHRSSRKRSTPTSGRRKESKDNIRVMFTGVAPTKKHKQMINDIGAMLIDSIEDAASATHVIATDGKTKLRRTPKLMICFCKTSNILGIEWLEQSAKEQKVLDPNDFLLLSDREAEKTYNFKLSDSLKNGSIARADRGGVLGGWYVYICSGVAGNKAPSAKEMKLIVEAAGATMLYSLAEKNVIDPAKSIIITSDPATKSQVKERGVDRVTSMGGHICTTSWLFQTMITQSLADVCDEKNVGHRSKRKAESKSPPSTGKRKSARRR